MSRVWHTTTSLNTGRQELGSCGIPSAALAFGGTTGSVTNVTEEFNNEIWTTSGNMPSSRKNMASFGTQNAGMSCAGYYSSQEEEVYYYNGTSWSTLNSLSTQKYSLAGCGNSSAGLIFGGRNASSLSVTEEFDGSTWTSGGNLNISRYNLTGFGTQTSAVSAGGYAVIGSNSGTTSVAESYNGTSWSTIENLILELLYISGAGTSSLSGVVFGPKIRAIFSTVSLTQEYNGINWYTGGILHAIRQSASGTGRTSFALCIGGNYSTAVFKYDVAITDENKFGAWETTTSINTARSWLAGAGSATSALAVGGGRSGDFTAYVGGSHNEDYDTFYNITEIWDNTSWTVSGNYLNSLDRLGVVGTTQAAFGFGGYSFDGSYDIYYTYGYSFNGTVWSYISASTQRCKHGYTGTESAGLFFGGTNSTGSLSSTLECNSGTWSSGGNLVAVSPQTTGMGTQSDTFSVTSTNTGSSASQYYNGATWTSGLLFSYFADSVHATGSSGSSGVVYIGEAVLQPVGHKSAFLKYYNGDWYSAPQPLYCNLGVGIAGTISDTLIFGGMNMWCCAVYGGYNASNPIITSNAYRYRDLEYSPISNAWTVVAFHPTIKRDEGSMCGNEEAGLYISGYAQAYFDFFGQLQNGYTEGQTMEYVGGNYYGWVNGVYANYQRVRHTSLGTQTAAVAMGGFLWNPDLMTNGTETYNGSSWTNGTGMSVAREGSAAAGTTTAGIVAGGRTDTDDSTSVELYNSGTWSNGVSLTIAIAYWGGSGTSTAMLCYGGAYGGEGEDALNSALEFNDTIWSSTSNLNIQRKTPGGSGSQSSTLAYAGAGTYSSAMNSSESYDGTSWSIRPSGIVARSWATGVGKSDSSALSHGGYTTSWYYGYANGLTESYSSTHYPIYLDGWRK